MAVALFLSLRSRLSDMLVCPPRLAVLEPLVQLHLWLPKHPDSDMKQAEMDVIIRRVTSSRLNTSYSALCWRWLGAWRHWLYFLPRFLCFSVKDHKLRVLGFIFGLRLRTLLGLAKG